MKCQQTCCVESVLSTVVDPIIPILYGRKVQKCNKVCQCQLQILPMPTADITLQYRYCENTVTVILSEHDHVRPW